MELRFFRGAENTETFKIKLSKNLASEQGFIDSERHAVASPKIVIGNVEIPVTMSDDTAIWRRTEYPAVEFSVQPTEEQLNNLSVGVNHGHFWVGNEIKSTITVYVK